MKRRTMKRRIKIRKQFLQEGCTQLTINIPQKEYEELESMIIARNSEGDSIDIQDIVLESISHLINNTLGK